MPRSKHDEYFARLYAEQSAGRDRFAPGVKVEREAAGPKPAAKPKPKALPPVYPLVALCRTAGLPVPTPEWKFHPVRAWRFDYAWPMYFVALEVEGAIWKQGGGGHSHPLGIERDAEKYSEAAILGWKVLRVAPEALRTRGMDYLFRIFAVQTKGKGP